MKKVISIALIALIWASCSDVPITNRNQLTLMPDSEMQTLSQQSYEEFMQKATVVKNTADARLVEKVGQNISSAVENYLREQGEEKRLKYFDWSYDLVQSTDVNAFCMPGGQIVFYTGILPYTENETGMAVVMGHEVAHAVARHSNEQITQQLALQLGANFLSLLLSGQSQQASSIVQSIYGVGTNVGVTLTFSRKHESEADRLGLIFMAMAGYDPNQAVSFWERMAANSSSLPEFLSTHPSDKTRIDNIKKELPEALKYYNP